MQRYEVLILTVPTITQDEIRQLESDIDTVIRKGGSIISFEKWGKYKLSYPVKKNSYGVYFLVRFTLDSENYNSILQSLSSLFAVKLNAIVMRHMVSLLEGDSSLTYTRPQSLEEEPDRKGDDELNKGKIEKILSKTESKKTIQRHDATKEVSDKSHHEELKVG